MAKKIDLISQKAMNQVLKDLAPVSDAVTEATEEIAAKARRNLEAHRYEGESSIEVDFGEIDGFVSLVDPDNAVSIEYGHKHNKTGEPVAGLYIITRAAGII
jgi:hypothetical protein